VYECSGKPHIPCVGPDDDDEDLVLLEELLPSANRAQIEQFVKERKGSLRFVPERRLVQLTGCTGGVVEQWSLETLASKVASVAAN